MTRRTDLSAYAFALRALATRDRSASELRRLLQRGGYTPEDIEAACARLTAAGAHDEARAAAAMAARLRRRGRATTRIRAELTARGFAPEAVKRAIADAREDGHDDAALARAVDHLAPSLRSADDVAKAMRRLHRRGFELRAIRAALAAHGATPPRVDDSALE